MWIFLLDRKEPTHYGEVESFVIVADSGQSACLMAAAKAGHEGEAAWLDGTRYRLTLLGRADPFPGADIDRTQRIVVRNYIDD